MHKKRILLHVLFLVLFLIGIGAAAYPAFGNWYNEQKRSVVLTEYEKALAKIEDADLTDAFKQAEIYNDALFTGETDEEERPDYGELLCTTEDGIMGYVEIPSIQIRLPIYHGCTENELSKSAGHLPSSSLPVGGKSTHAVLAAHSGRADSKMFTDLDQVKEGDLVYLYVLNKTLTYEVDKITVTTPDDTDAIQIIDGEDLLTLLTCTPFGVQTMSQDMPGLVQTSLNLGIMYTDEDRQVLRASIRSSVATQKKAVLDQLICLTEQLGGTTEAEGDYPGWEYMPQSPLRERMVEVYQEQYGKEPTIKAMHAGVECGLFSEKLPGLDCVSFGPDLSDIHTPRERMHIASVQRTWELVKEVLKRSK